MAAISPSNLKDGSQFKSHKRAASSSSSSSDVCATVSPSPAKRGQPASLENGLQQLTSVWENCQKQQSAQDAASEAADAAHRSAMTDSIKSIQLALRDQAGVNRQLTDSLRVSDARAAEQTNILQLLAQRLSNNK